MRNIKKIIKPYRSRRFFSSKHSENESSIKKLFKDNTNTAQNVVQSINRNQLLIDLKALYREAERRKYNMRWIGIAGLGIGTYFFYGVITDWATDQAADVTTKYLENPKFKRDIIIFVEDTIDELVKSERVQNDITGLLEQSVYQLADTPEIQDKLAELFTNVFQSETIKNAGGELSEDVVRQLLHSDEYSELREEAIKYIIDETIKIINDDELQRNAGIASWNAFKVWFGGGPPIQNETIENLKDDISKSINEKT